MIEEKETVEMPFSGPLTKDDAVEIMEKNLGEFDFIALSYMIASRRVVIATTAVILDSKNDRGILFGYLPESREWEVIYTCSKDEWPPEKHDESVKEWKEDVYPAEKVHPCVTKLGNSTI